MIRFGRVGSTMDIAAEFAAAGEPEGLVVFADEQTDGRGRAGRTWQAPPGSSLLLTVLLRPIVPVERLGVLAPLAGVALAEAIEAETGLRCWLKWPNDVWLGDRNAGRKAAGVLATARLARERPEYVLVGIGVNVDAPPEALPAGATSIGVELGRRGWIRSVDDPAAPGAEGPGYGNEAGVGLRTGRHPDLLGNRQKDPADVGCAPLSADEPCSRNGGEAARDANDSEAVRLPNPARLGERVLAALLVRLDEHYAAFLETAGRPPLDGWRRRAALLGEPVRVDGGEGTERGVHAGIDDDGALLLRGRDGTLRRVVAGDLTRGPRQDETGKARAS